MESIRLLLLGLLLVGSYGGWNNPFPLYSSWPIRSQVSFIDDVSGKAHLLFAVENNFGPFAHYASFKPNGEKTAAYNLTRLKVSKANHPFALTGPHNGKGVYAVLTLLRDGYNDLYFMESTSDGHFWSKPTLARGNNLDDHSQRDLPSLVSTKSDRLFLFYRKDSALYFTMRPPDTTVWSVEKRIETKDCAGLESVQQLFSAALYENSTRLTVLFHLACRGPTGVAFPLTGETKDYGLSWRYFKHPQQDKGNGVQSAVTGRSEAGYIYGAVGVPEDSWKRLTTFKYGIGAQYQEIASGPISSTAIPLSYRLCTLNNVLSLLYYDRTILKATAVDKPWEGTTLPLPSLSSVTIDDSVDCGDGHLFATGYQDNIVQAQWYTMTSTSVPPPSS